MMHVLRHLRPCALFLAVVASANCGDDEGSGKGYTILAPGTGPTNTRLLWNPSLGYFGIGGVIDGVVPSVHGPLLRQTSTPPKYTLWRVADDGIFYAGDQDLGVLATPRLWIPATVRVGMRWSVYDAGKEDSPDLTFEVVAHDDAEGRWDIKKHDPQGIANDQGQTYREILSGDNAQRIIPGAANRYPPPAHQALTLRALPLKIPQYPTLTPGLVRVGDGPAVLMGPRLEGNQYDLCEYIDADGARPERAPEGGMFGRTQGPACVGTVKCNSADCAPLLVGMAETADVAPDGTVTWTPPFGVRASKSVLSRNNSSGYNVTSYGPVHAPDGSLRLMYSVDDDGVMGRAVSLDADILAKTEWANFPDTLDTTAIAGASRVIAVRSAASTMGASRRRVTPRASAATSPCSARSAEASSSTSASTARSIASACRSAPPRSACSTSRA